MIDLARDNLNPDLELARRGAQHRRHADASTRARRLEALRERFGDKVFDTVIRQSIRYAESAERAVSILDYRPELGADYMSLADELLRRLQRPELLTPLDELSTELVPAGASR